MASKKKIISLCLALMVFIGALAGCGAAQNAPSEDLADFSHSKIGVLTGSSFDLLASEYYPEAQKLCYINMSDLILNLKQGKIDGILMDKGFFSPLQWEDKELSFVELDMPHQESILHYLGK